MKNRLPNKLNIIIFGATGDLTKRKLIPALFKLFIKGKIKRGIKIVGVARRNLSKKEFIEELKIDEFIPNAKKKDLDRFFSLLSYIAFDLKKGNAKGFGKNFGEGNKILYLAISPELFKHALDKIKESGILKGSGWKRIAFEKPFGHDLKSAEKLNKYINSVFNEEQIYRIDHYLGKDLVQSIMTFRFSNPLFESVWNKKYVDNVQINMLEKLTVGDRGEYYDKAGAIRDMMQNHMLQVLSITAMEKPKSLNASDIKDEKVKVLKKLKQPEVIVGQYDEYTNEKSIDKNSKTETFAAFKTEIKNKRWEGVPFYLRTGKGLDKTYSEVNLILKDNSCELFCTWKKHLGNNIITIRIQPDEGMIVDFNTKKPGPIMSLDKVRMDFCHNCLYGVNTMEAYEILLYEIMVGDKTLFTRWDETRESWKFIDKIKKGKLYRYKKGGKGPKKAENMVNWVAFREASLR